jgi:hypothetical protein
MRGKPTKTGRRNTPDSEDRNPKWQEIVNKFLAYAEHCGLRKHRLTRGWKLTVHDHVIFHLQEMGQKVGITPQFGFLERWCESSLLQQFYHRLEPLFEKPNHHRLFPTIKTCLQEHPEAFAQLCEALEWFLEQVQKKTPPFRVRKSRPHVRKTKG